jgi:hypothetical protein
MIVDKGSMKGVRRRNLVAAGTAWLPLSTALWANDVTNPGPTRNVDGMMDNSFLIEEAYNQEPGVVQHIFTTIYAVDQLHGRDDKLLNLAFTQEWPLFSQTHQFSYTVPYNFVRRQGQSHDGVGDVFLNYRFQAYYNEENLRAVAPRFSLVLPTGNVREDFGDDSLGYQWNLPFSTAIGDRWFAHANAGLTWLPDLLRYNLGASAIYCATPDLHFLLEWVGFWNELSAPQGGRDREFSSLLSPGVRRAFNFRNDSQLVIGLGLPIGLTSAAPDFGAFLYLSFEHRFLKKQ